MFFCIFYFFFFFFFFFLLFSFILLVQPIKCELCSNWEKRNRMEKHTMYNCPMRLVRCRYCNESMPAKIMNTHVDETCSRRLLKCLQKCGKEIGTQIKSIYLFRCFYHVFLYPKHRSFF